MSLLSILTRVCCEFITIQQDIIVKINVFFSCKLIFVFVTVYKKRKFGQFSYIGGQDERELGFQIDSRSILGRLEKGVSTKN